MLNITADKLNGPWQQARNATHHFSDDTNYAMSGMGCRNMVKMGEEVEDYSKVLLSFDININFIHKFIWALWRFIHEMASWTSRKDVWARTSYIAHYTHIRRSHESKWIFKYVFSITRSARKVRKQQYHYHILMANIVFNGSTYFRNENDCDSVFRILYCRSHRSTFIVSSNWICARCHATNMNTHIEM